MIRFTLLALLHAAALAARVADAGVTAGSSPGLSRVAPPASAIAKLDPWLARVVSARPDTVITVWVELADKGERDPADLADRLARAEAALTPRNRARRVRAGVRPLVDARDLPVEARYLDALRARGLQPFAVSRWLDRAAVRVAAARLPELAALPWIVRVSKVARVWSMRPPDPPDPIVPDDPKTLTTARRLASVSGAPARANAIDYGRSLAELQQIGVPALHDSGYTGRGVLVCVLDGSFQYFDRHVATRTIDVPPGHVRDFGDGDTVVTDGSAAFPHGLWVLGGLGANHPGELVGSAFGATFALARTEIDGSETPVEMLYWGQGAEWADSLGADLISSSLGYNTFDPGYEGSDYTYADMDGQTTEVSRAAEIAAAKGILVVNAVGNKDVGWIHLTAPADVNGDSLVAVGAVASNGLIASFSSIGPSADGRIKPDLVARGVANPVPGNGDSTEYVQKNGTSMSTPLIAGLAACLMQARPRWTPQMVIRALRETASNADHPDNEFGYGVPNGGAALRWDPSGFRRPGVLGIAMLGPNPQRPGGSPSSVRVGLGSAAGDDLAARVDVFDAVGRRIKSLWSGHLLKGASRTTAWAGDDGGGGRVRPGVYWIAVTSGRNAASVRVVAL